MKALLTENCLFIRLSLGMASHSSHIAYRSSLLKHGSPTLLLHRRKLVFGIVKVLVRFPCGSVDGGSFCWQHKRSQTMEKRVTLTEKESCQASRLDSLLFAFPRRKLFSSCRIRTISLHGHDARGILLRYPGDTDVIPK